MVQAFYLAFLSLEVALISYTIPNLLFNLL